MIVQKVNSFIKKYNMISEHDLVAAGISGGADSLCLFWMLLEYRKIVPFDLVAVHVNHLIRKEAGEDAAFVKEICDREKIPFYLKEADVGKLATMQHLSEEEAGRKVRYEAFEEALRLYKKEENTACKIAVAHHQGDSAETMLFHLFRGTGLYGMTGILPVNGNIIRPLLNVSREEIEEYLRKRGQDWCIDCTNEEDTYTRNKIRHHILGYANREINQRSTEHIAKAAYQIAALRKYLDYEIEKMMKETAKAGPDFISVEIAKLKVYPEFLQGQFVLTAIDKVIPGRKDIASEHIQGILGLLDKTGTKRMDLPQNMEAVKEYGILWIRRRKETAGVEKEAKDILLGVGCGTTKENRSFGSSLPEKKKSKPEEGNYCLPDGSILEISFIKPEDLGRIEEKKYTKYFDYDKINSCLMLRFRQPGDYLTINDQGQKKSLKEYFINEKIPVSVRGELPVIADGNHILWIVGYRISAYYKVTSETQKIVQMTIRRDKNVREN